MGDISESLIAGRKLILIERPEVYEDTHMINMLKSKKLAISISEDKLQCLDINALLESTARSINEESLVSFRNDINAVLELLPL